MFSLRTLACVMLGAVASGLVHRSLPSTRAVRASSTTALEMASGSQVAYRIRRKRLSNQVRQPRRRLDVVGTGGGDLRGAGGGGTSSRSRVGTTRESGSDRAAS